MADLVITPADVLPLPGAKTFKGISGDDTIVAGETIWLDGNRLQKAFANNVDASVVKGVALNDAASEQPLTICTEGELDVGSAVEGVSYFQSIQSGKMAAPETDITAPNYKTLVGIGKAGGILVVGPVASRGAVQ